MSNKDLGMLIAVAAGIAALHNVSKKEKKNKTNMDSNAEDFLNDAYYNNINTFTRINNRC